MAFDLNKNDETSKADSKSKFDLSKSDSPSAANIEKGGKSKSWLLILIGFLIVGGAAWYFLSNSKSNKDAIDTAVVQSNTPEVSSGTNIDSANKSTPVDSVPASSNVASSSPTLNNNTTNPTNAGEVTNPVKTAEPSINKAQTQTDNTNNSGSSSNSISSASLNNKVPASFSKASSSFSNIDKSIIKDIITYLGKNSNASITVNGFASSEGELNINQKISQSRADAFKRYLISKGVSANRINATGKGIDSPIASNDTEEGRQKNRRVEIVL